VRLLEGLIAEGSPIHPHKHFIVCTNLIGGCYGSTGPSSIDPRTSRRHAAGFPQITTGDMIEAQRTLLCSLGIDRSLTLMGGSLGGMLALEWAVRHPGEVKHAIALVSPGRSSPQAIAFRCVQREAILSDPEWNGGNCYEGRFPLRGLSLARKIGMITYRSAAEFEARFRRDERDTRLHFLEGQFEIQSYLEHQGKKFCDRFDPNTYLYFSRAMDLYDLGKGHASFEDALARVEGQVLLLAVDSDILVPAREVMELHESLAGAGKRSRLEIIHSIHGHDSFLIELGQINEHVKRLLDGS
jgi:homoserine O-acetyltransferase